MQVCDFEIFGILGATRLETEGWMAGIDRWVEREGRIDDRIYGILFSSSRSLHSLSLPQ